IRAGFQKATSAILDGNITTLIAAAVLYAFGSGSVRGFAMTLALGIVLSMFTALAVSRLLVNCLYSSGIKNEKCYGKQKPRKKLSFVEHKKIYFTISVILMLIVPVGMLVMNAVKGSPLNFGLDFKGGTSVTVPFNENYTIAELESQVQPLVENITNDSDIQMTKVVDSNDVIIKTRSLSLEEREALYNDLESEFGVDVSNITFDNISSTISKEMSANATKAVIISVICMLLYIWFRFRDIRFASSAILALIHDIAVVFGFYVFSRISVGNTFIACMLTILGYSINSTIVIFDRIRENMPNLKRESLEALVDQSITDTLTRSIYSSLTTFVMIFVLFLMGVSSIRDFAAPLMVGIISGAYTSVCLTGSLWYVMKHYGKKKYVPAAAKAEKTGSQKTKKK
ncbi:MAG: protein translocase subunit SecF, partial [Lachnospiraceae bacterium]|nr:protein translocase subunit SecF [Lachnospiraceae bacterium]